MQTCFFLVQNKLCHKVHFSGSSFHALCSGFSLSSLSASNTFLIKILHDLCSADRLQSSVVFYPALSTITIPNCHFSPSQLVSAEAPSETNMPHWLCTPTCLGYLSFLHDIPKLRKPQRGDLSFVLLRALKNGSSLNCTASNASQMYTFVILMSPQSCFVPTLMLLHLICC